MFNSSNKIMSHHFYHAMHGKFLWHLTENMDGRITNANEIEFQGVKSKF